MRDRTPLECIIPIPASFAPCPGVWAPKTAATVAAPAEWAALRDRACRIFAAFGLDGRSADGAADLRIEHDPALGAEAWRLDVMPDGVRISGGDRIGAFYALGAFAQVLTVASASGMEMARIACGTVADRPRFARRGFMLDCARHFQSKTTVLRVLQTMVERRLNVFHWHLTDSQGWRLDLPSAPASISPDRLDRGFYSREEVAEIAAFAAARGIEIVPEIDVPGHARALTEAFPELACDPAHPGSELCIGKPGTMAFLQRIWDETLALFPASRFVHIGGDEASVGNWQACPHCQAAMRENGLGNERELENRFMEELAGFIRSRGRTPVVWSTQSTFGPGTVVQIWQDMRDLPRHVKAGCRAVMSLHTSYYFDYPATPDEPFADWMFALPEEAVYMAEPYVIWKEEARDSLLGPEACLWTETVPDWRVLPKILSRLDAFAETAWSFPERRDWHDFLARKSRLAAAGYAEIVRKVLD